LGFFLKESVLHEMEKPVVTLEILKNDVRSNGAVARLGRPKTMNNGSTNPQWNLRPRPTTSKTRLQKKAKTCLKTQKRIQYHFTPISKQASALKEHLKEG